MRKHKKLILLLCITFLVAVTLFGWWGILNVAPYGIVGPFRTLNQPKTEYLEKNYTRFNVELKDSITLKGYLIKRKSEPAYGTVIILHGIGNNKESQIQMAESFAENGINVIIFDLRGHGESGGKYCTYGYYEKYDIVQIIDKIVKEIPDAGSIGIIGSSLGGAISIQAMATDKRIKCGVIVSAFASLDDITYDYMKRMLFIPFRFVSEMALKEAGRIAKFDPFEVVPSEYAKRIKQPVMFVHGSDDGNINIRYAEKNFANTESPDKSFYIIRDAHHNDVNEIGGEAYREELIKFFRKYNRSDKNITTCEGVPEKDICIKDKNFDGYVALKKMPINKAYCIELKDKSHKVISSVMYKCDMYKLEVGDINNDGNTDIELGIIKSARFDPVVKRRLFILQIDHGKLRPLWLGTRLCRDLVDFEFTRGNKSTIRTIEIEDDSNYCVGEYCWNDFGLRLTRYLNQHLSFNKANQILHYEKNI